MSFNDIDVNVKCLSGAVSLLVYYMREYMRADFKRNLEKYFYMGGMACTQHGMHPAPSSLGFG